MLQLRVLAASTAPAAASTTPTAAALVPLMVVIVALLLSLASANPLAAWSLPLPGLAPHPLLRLARLAMAEDRRLAACITSQAQAWRTAAS